jgi:hypothetical protein
LKIEGGQLVLATSNPTDVLALDDSKTLSGPPVRPVVALKADTKKLQNRAFGIGEEDSELIETSGDDSRRGHEGSTLSVTRADEGGSVILSRAVKAGMMRIRADGLIKAARGVTPIEEILRTTA